MIPHVVNAFTRIMRIHAPSALMTNIYTDSLKLEGNVYKNLNVGHYIQNVLLLLILHYILAALSA